MTVNPVQAETHARGRSCPGPVLPVAGRLGVTAIWEAGMARVGDKLKNEPVVTILFPLGSDGTGRSNVVLEREMSETLETDVINQALEIIDRSLGTLHQRELVSAAEVSDLLLDMRSLLAVDLAEVGQLEEAAAN